MLARGAITLVVGWAESAHGRGVAMPDCEFSDDVGQIQA